MKSCLCCDEVMIKVGANITHSARYWFKTENRSNDVNAGRRQTDDSGEATLIWKLCGALSGIDRSTLYLFSSVNSIHFLSVELISSITNGESLNRNKIDSFIEWHGEH